MAGLTIEPYGDRFFALYDGDELVCVTVYKKGANEVKRRLEEKGGGVNEIVARPDASCGREG